MKLGKLICIAAALLLVTLTAVAKDKHKKHGEKENKAEAKHSLAPVEVKPAVTIQREPVARVTITTTERESIRKFVTGGSTTTTYTTPVASRSQKLPPGLAKQAARGKPLPPGWEKKMQAGEVMPVEVFHQCQPLPKELVIKLPPQPKGVITVAVEGKVVRLLEATREILDVFDVFSK